MTASLTNYFREHLLGLLKADIDSDGTQYYIGIASGQEADEVPFTQMGSLENQMKFRHTLQSVKTLSNVSYVVPTIEWTVGTEYEAYDINDPNQTNFYVVNSDNEVFLCLEKGLRADGTTDGSLIEPTSVLANNSTKPFKTVDGYIWQYLYKISNLAYGTFKTKSYMPVKQITNELTTIPEEIEQKLLQDSSIEGMITGIIVDDGGSGYINPTITISGNGYGARFIADVFDEHIVNVRCDSNGLGSLLHGKNYDYAKVEITDPGSGSGAKLRPVVSPRKGTNKDPVTTLKCNAIMLQTDIIGTENNTIVANDTNFKKIGILKDITNFENDNVFIANTGQAMKRLLLSSVNGSWFENDIFSNALGTSKGKVFYLDGTTLYYYQDQETGFNPFQISEAITNTEDGTADIVAIQNPEIDRYSGELLYINTLENTITREEVQTEDIRIVIQLG